MTRTINGIKFNGFILYGVDEPLLKKIPNQHVNEFIDCNKVWYSKETELQEFQYSEHKKRYS